jgi:succinate dehydrogenase / fumarate reductase cytochrome b subunit
MGRYAFFPGCAAKGVAKELYESSVEVFKALELDVVELEEFSCCGAGVLEEIKDELDLVVNARNLAYAEKYERDILTVCSTCLRVLLNTKRLLDEDEDLREKVNKVLKDVGLEYTGKADVKLFHWVLLEEFGEGLKDKVKRKLNLKVYPYYGCHTLRPSDTIRYEFSENPNSLEKLIEILGAEPVSGTRKLECCGFHAFWMAPKLSMKLTGLNLKDAKDNGADCIVTPCPLCHTNLDANQSRALKEINEFFEIPVLHVPQLVGLALGISEEKLGLKRNIVPFKTLGGVR